MPKQRPPRVTFRLNEKTLAQVASAAVQERRTLSDLLRVIIYDWLDDRGEVQHERRRPKARRRDRGALEQVTT